MYGAIIGDIAGSRFEFDNHRDKRFTLFHPLGFVTDDTVMSLALAQAVMEADRLMPLRGPDYELLLAQKAVSCMKAIGRHYPDCGYGGRFYRWMFSARSQPYNSFGNGAAMRVSAAGLAARTLEEALVMSDALPAVTHNHPEGILGARATTLCIFLARQGHSQADIRRRVEQEYYRLDMTVEGLRPVYRFDATCQGTVPQAIVCFLEATSFEDAIRNAISIGGDSDTIGAITGAIAQAYFGVPEDMKEQAAGYLDERLLAILADWDASGLGQGRPT